MRTCRCAVVSSAGRICAATSRAHAEGLAAEKELGEHALALRERVFWAWEVSSTPATAASSNARSAPCNANTSRSSAPTPPSARNKRCRGIARNLLKAWPAPWTFASHAGVESTNNHAERALRSAVIYRKLCLPSQSEGGELRTTRLLSAHTTCRLQRRSLFAYLSDAIAAHARGKPTPLLT
jgi:Transposase IS66 family